MGLYFGNRTVDCLVSHALNGSLNSRTADYFYGQHSIKSDSTLLCALRGNNTKPAVKRRNQKPNKAQNYIIYCCNNVLDKQLPHLKVALKIKIFMIYGWCSGHCV